MAAARADRTTTLLLICAAFLPSAGLTASNSHGPPAEMRILAEQQAVPLVTWAVADGNDRLSGSLRTSAGGTGLPRPEPVFHAASVTKPVVAVAVLRLAQQGVVDLDAPVVRYITEPGFAILAAHGLTARHLLTHRSGLKDFKELNWLEAGNDPRRLRATLLMPGVLEFQAAPGGEFSYTNLNYSLLGALIEAVSGADFAGVVRDLALIPYDAPRARLSCQDIPAALLATPHVFASTGEPAPSRLVPFNREHSPSSGLCITATELAAWGASLLDCSRVGAPLDCAALRSMFPAAGQRYGLGWYDRELAGNLLLWHDGSDAGYAAGLVLAPQRRISVAVLTNFEFASAGVMAQMLMTQRLRTPYVAAHPFPDQAQWQRYAGTYYHEELPCAEIVATPAGLQMHYQTPVFPYELTRTRLIPKPEWDEGYFIGAFRGKPIWFGQLAQPANSYLFMASRKLLREPPDSQRCSGLQGSVR